MTASPPVTPASTSQDVRATIAIAVAADGRLRHAAQQMVTFHDEDAEDIMQHQPASPPVTPAAFRALLQEYADRLDYIVYQQTVADWSEIRDGARALRSCAVALERVEAMVQWSLDTGDYGGLAHDLAPILGIVPTPIPTDSPE